MPSSTTPGGRSCRRAWRVTLVILACTMVGQSMEDALNPRLKVGHLAVRRFRVRPLHGQLDAE